MVPRPSSHRLSRHLHKLCIFDSIDLLNLRIKVTRWDEMNLREPQLDFCHDESSEMHIQNDA